MSNGLNDYAANSEMREELRKDFTAAQITKVDKGFGKIDTINHAIVTDRLNRAAPGWTYQIERVTSITDKNNMPHVLAVFGSMTIGSVTRWEVGEAERMTHYGDEMKKALSDFIKRAAMRYGVGIQIWAKGDLDEPQVSSDTATTGSSKPHAAASLPGVGALPAASGASEDGPGASDEPRPTQSTPEQVNLDGPGVEGEPLSGSAPLGSGGGGGSPTNYLTKDDQGLLKAEYGGQVAALKAYKARFGDRITRLADITYEMRDEMGVNA